MTLLQGIHFDLSKDESAVVKDGVETAAICHFCKATKEFGLPALGALNSSIVYNKPQKWAVIFGGTKRDPKRFFICNGCAKSVCTH